MVASRLISVLGTTKARRIIPAVFLASALLASGCSGGKSSAPIGQVDPPTLQAAQRLPDGTNVIAALEQKDYETLVSTLGKIHQSITSDEQRRDVMVLDRYVNDQLVQLSPTNDAAADAFKAVRLLMVGR